MTVRELLETNATITLLDVEVRDNGELVEEYRIGMSARKHQGEHYVDGVLRRPFNNKPIYLKTESINNRTSGRDYYGVVFKNIDNKVADMVVDSWTTAHDYYTAKELVGDFTELHVITLPEAQQSLKLWY